MGLALGSGGAAAAEGRCGSLRETMNIYMSVELPVNPERVSRGAFLCKSPRARALACIPMYIFFFCILDQLLDH